MRKELDIKPMEPTNKTYIPPRIAVQVVELEQGIASGSAAVSPDGATGTVKEEWGTSTNRDSNLDW